MESGIEKYAMLIMKYKKRQKEKNAKPGNNQRAWRKGKRQVLGNIRSEHHQTSGNERTNKKRVSQTNEKLSITT